MTAMFVLWLLIGVATGVLHAFALWGAAHRMTGRIGLPWRLPLVGAALVAAALVGGILPTAAGWAAGLATTGVVLLVRQRRWM